MILKELPHPRSGVVGLCVSMLAVAGDDEVAVAFEESPQVQRGDLEREAPVQISGAAPGEQDGKIELRGGVVADQPARKRSDRGQVARAMLQQVADPQTSSGEAGGVDPILVD